ncbi:thioredoxin domain-containing protein [Allosphingosinicella indica]|uniref:Protein-disulfide isomerase n=1 Tax=Allosphingosinicella indica TaxID=941907 RepID=A0A1X7GGK0_9SPHN|nr:thioredoxin domain-containing protein [Allosphingosinicella indica]SMF68812.1 Protein-disulfide isomerase [Allosphingosinicella indica]
MKALIQTGALSLAMLLAGCGDNKTADGNSSTAATAPVGEAIPAPNGGDWTTTVSATPEGGFIMGNPNAPVKVVEYASMTCPHCRDFSATGTPQLVEKYVKTGQVSYEFRNFLLNAIDMSASLLARCGGATPFFKLTEQMYQTQDQWVGKLQTLSPDQQKAFEGMAPNQVTGAIADAAGLIDFVRVRGIPEEKARQCLANQSEIDKLVELGQKTMQQHPDFPGTPTFLINGEMARNTGTWEALEPQIREKL